MSEHCKEAEQSRQRRKVLHFPRWVESWKISRGKDGRWEVIGESAMDKDAELPHNTNR